MPLQYIILLFIFYLNYVTGSVSVEKEDSLATIATNPFLQKGSLSEVFLGMKVGGSTSIGVTGGASNDNTIIPDQQIPTDKKEQHHLSIEPEITSEQIVNETGLPPLKPPSFYNDINTFVPISKTKNTTTTTTKKKIHLPKNSKCNECSKIHGHPLYPLPGFRVHERLGPLVPVSKKPMDFIQKQHLHVLLHQKSLSITDAILCLDSHPFTLIPFSLPISSFLTASAVRTLDHTHLLWSLPAVMWSTVMLILLITLLVTLDYIVYDVAKTIWYSVRGDGGNNFSPTFFFSKDGFYFIVHHFKYSLFGGTFPLLSSYRKAGAGSSGARRRSSPSQQQQQQQQQIKRKKSKRLSLHPQTPQTPQLSPAVAKVQQPAQPLAMPSPQRRHHSISFSLNESTTSSSGYSAASGTGTSTNTGTGTVGDAEDCTDSFDVKVNHRSNRKKRSSIQQHNPNDDSGTLSGCDSGFGHGASGVFNVNYRTSSPTLTLTPKPTPTPSPSPTPIVPLAPLFEVENDEDLDRRRADWVRGMPLFECASIVGPPSIVTAVRQPLAATASVPTTERPSRRFTIHSSSSTTTFAPPTSPRIQRQTIPTPPPGFDNIVTTGGTGAGGGSNATLSATATTTTCSSQQSSFFAFPSRTTTFTDNENSWLWFLPSSYGGTSATTTTGAGAAAGGGAAENFNNDSMAVIDDPPRGGQFARFSQSGRSTPSGASSDELD